MSSTRTAVLTRIELQSRMATASERGLQVVRFDRPRPASPEARDPGEIREAILRWLEQHPDER
jgi:hypothetical protein